MYRPIKSIWFGTSQALCAPLFLAALATRAKSFEGNPIIGSSKFNNWGLHAARVSLAHSMAQRRRRPFSKLVPLADRLAFERDGFILRGDFLPARSFADLIEQLGGYRHEMREVLQGNTVNRKIPVTSSTLNAVPALRELLFKPEWRAFIRYVGSSSSAPSVFIQTIIRRADNELVDPQTLLHADTFHPSVKA